MINVVILDDEIRAVKVIEHLLQSHPGINVLSTFTDPLSAVTFINQQSPDVLILDINMPGLNGFEVLDRINNKTIKIIFTTAHDNFALKAFHYSAMDYLLKPIDEAQFNSAITKVINQAEKTDFSQSISTLIHNISSIKDPMAMKICIPNVNGFSIVDSNQIMYCEADSCYTIFKMKDGSQIISSKTLAEYEGVLDENVFFRIHRSYFINLSQINEYHKGNGGFVTMANGVELEVSRRKKEEFLNKVKTVFK
jgi:two-component system, LytTR family, response regulator